MTELSTAQLIATARAQLDGADEAGVASRRDALIAAAHVSAQIATVLEQRRIANALEGLLALLERLERKL